MKNPFKKEKIRVMHPAIPGVEVVVYRNKLQQFFYPKDFAMPRELDKAID